MYWPRQDTKIIQIYFAICIHIRYSTKMSEPSSQTKYNYGAAHARAHETAAVASPDGPNTMVFIAIGAILLIVVIIYLYVQHTKKSKDPDIQPAVSCTVKPCTAPEICEPVSGSCMSCMQDPALCTGAASACDPIRGCVAPCTQTGTGACESGYTCNATSSLCLKICDDANSCGFGQTCIQGECELISCADNDIPCPTGQKCALGLIPDLAHCVNIPCNQPGAIPCAKGLYCNVKNGLCSTAPLCLLGPILSKCPPEFPICYNKQCMDSIPCVVGGTDPSKWCPTGAMPYCTNGICGAAPACSSQHGQGSNSIGGCQVGEFCVAPSAEATSGVCTQNIPVTIITNERSNTYRLLQGYKAVNSASNIATSGNSYPCPFTGPPMEAAMGMANEIGNVYSTVCNDCYIGHVKNPANGCISGDEIYAYYFRDAPLAVDPDYYALTNSGPV